MFHHVSSTVFLILALGLSFSPGQLQSRQETTLPDQSKISSLIEQLKGVGYADRQRADSELVKRGDAAIPALADSIVSGLSLP